MHTEIGLKNIGIKSIYDYIFNVAILKIAKLGHPVLIKKTNEINDLNKVDLKKIVFELKLLIKNID